MIKNRARLINRTDQAAPRTERTVPARGDYRAPRLNDTSLSQRAKPSRS